MDALSESSFQFAPFTGSELTLIADMALELASLKRAIEAKTEEVKALQAQYDAIEQGRLPDLMLDIGMTSITLTDGAKLERIVEYHPSIKVENRLAAFKYLRDNDLGDIIKAEITITYSKGEEKLVRRQMSNLLRTKANAERKIILAENVHPSTLKALVKERINSDEPLPTDLFGIHEITKAVIKLPRMKNVS